MKFVVTTRKEILETLKTEGYYIIGVDGTVPDAVELYDELYDHHRKHGADIQIDEILGTLKSWTLARKNAIITTMVDADAIVAAYYIWSQLYQQEFLDAQLELLKAISYDCDHLNVPSNLSQYATEAAMIVAALKESSNDLPNKLGLKSNRKEWSVEDKELYASTAFEQGVKLIDTLLNSNWDYQKIAQPYWEKLENHVLQIIKEHRISIYRNCLIFDSKGLNTYVDPRCWIIASSRLGYHPDEAITLTVRDIFQNNEYKGISYTLGTFPLHPHQKKWDYTDKFKHLTELEKSRNPNSGEWGGRATVGGSPWNNPSMLLPVEIINTILKDSD